MQIFFVQTPLLPNTQISREAKTWRVANSHKATLLCWLVRDLRFPWRCYIKLSSFYFSFFIWAPSKDQQNHKIPPLGNDRSVYQQQQQQQQSNNAHLKAGQTHHLGGVHFLHCIPGRMNLFGTAGNVSYPLSENVKMFRTPKDDSSKCFIPPILPQA